MQPAKPIAPVTRRAIENEVSPKDRANSGNPSTTRINENPAAAMLTGVRFFQKKIP
jgi:hypothetical protein